MLKIQRSSNGRVVFLLSGRVGPEGVDELQRLIHLEPGSQEITFDLRDVTLIDRDAVRFLASCELKGIELENCPAYIREWIDRDRNNRQDAKRL